MKTIEILLENNKKQINLVKKLLKEELKNSQDAEADRFDFLLSLIEKKIALPGKYVEEVYKGSIEHGRLFSNRDWKKIGDIFKSAGYNSMAEELYGFINGED